MLWSCKIARQSLAFHPIKWRLCAAGFVELEVEAANQYRLLRVQGAIAAAPEQENIQLEQEIERYEQEMAVLEEELTRLEEQKAQFPAVSFRGYLKTLLGKG